MFFNNNNTVNIISEKSRKWASLTASGSYKLIPNPITVTVQSSVLYVGMMPCCREQK